MNVGWGASFERASLGASASTCTLPIVCNAKTLLLGAIEGL